MRQRAEFDYRYSIIPGGAVTDPDVSMRDLQVLALLGRHTDKKGWCWRSQVEMAQELRCGRATVSRSIKRLVKAGWLEQEALPRGRAVLVEGEQPFSAFRYRVKIDRDDEVEQAAGDVPNNGHPPVDQPKSRSNNGQGVPINSGQGVPIQVGTHKKDPLKGPPLTSARDALTRWPDVWAAFLTWPNLPDTATEARAKIVWVRMQAELPEPDTLIRLILAEGDRLRAGGKRGGWANAPHNWLEKYRGWESGLEALDAQQRTADAMAAKRDGIIAALGADVLAKLRRAGLREADIDMLEGVRFEAGPPAVLVCLKAYQRSQVMRHSQGLDGIWPGIRFELASERQRA